MHLKYSNILENNSKYIFNINIFFFFVLIIMDTDYKQKYLKYKLKYLELCAQIGGNKEFEKLYNILINTKDEFKGAWGSQTADIYNTSKKSADKLESFIHDNDNKNALSNMTIEYIDDKINNLNRFISALIGNISTTKTNKNRGCNKECKNNSDDKIKKYNILITKLKNITNILTHIKKLITEHNKRKEKEAKKS